MEKIFPAGLKYCPIDIKWSGGDFYKYCLSVIQQYPNVDIVWAEINEIGTTGESAWLIMR
jgi:hypothetical protein